MSQHITIDPITRLEGHGKIEIFLDTRARWPTRTSRSRNWRGFERFCIGRAAEEMPASRSASAASARRRTTWRRPGPSTTCTTSTRRRRPTSSANSSTTSSCSRTTPCTSISWAGRTSSWPDGAGRDQEHRGRHRKVGLEIGGKVIEARKLAREFMAEMAGKVIHPVFGLPGGVSKPLKAEMVDRLKAASQHLVDFAQFSLQAFHDIVLGNQAYVDTILADYYAHKTNYMGTVDANGKINFYRGELRVIDPSGKRLAQFPPRDYLKHIAEHVEPWSYIKFPFLKTPGWKGFVDGPESGLYRVAPLARLNVADGMATPLARRTTRSSSRSWAASPCTARWPPTGRASSRPCRPPRRSRPWRTIPRSSARSCANCRGAADGRHRHRRGAPRHAHPPLRHGPERDPHDGQPDRGDRPQLGADPDVHRESGKRRHPRGKADQGLLNMVEMAFRAYDPCFGCATHSLPGEMPLRATIRDARGGVVEVVERKGRLGA